MAYFAQINSENICTAVSSLIGEDFGPDMIPINYLNYALIGKKYKGNGRWEDVPHPEWPLSEAEQIAISNALNIEYLVCLAESDI